MSVVDTGWPCLCLEECDVQLETRSDLTYQEEQSGWMGVEQTARRNS